MSIKNYLLAICLLLSNWMIGQNGILLNTEEALPSYTLFQNSMGTYLIDNCGEELASWPSLQNSRYHPKLLPNGNVFHIKNNEIVEHDWDDNIVNTITHLESNLSLTYEAIALPNGNYLALARRIEPSAFFNFNSYNPDSGNFTSDDTVVEIDANDGSIVWEWRISDHIIQQRDSSLSNYGILKDNPQLLDVDAISTYDWTGQESFMINGFDYNPELDQIALSVRKISEVVIIDHSTTTEEASGHTGGNSGKGGDILYRWGNPQNYNQGGPEDRILYYQHNPNWIEHGEHEGSIVIFNNGLNRPGTTFFTQYSSAEILNADINLDGSYNKEPGQPFLPAQADFTLSGANDEFYSGYTCGAEVLSNGNIFITIGGNLIEYNMQGQKVWEYQAPFTGLIFRSEKYALDYTGFDDKDVTPNGAVSGSTSSYQCEYYNGVSTENLSQTLDMRLTQTEGKIILENEKKFSYSFYNSNGQLLVCNHNQKHFHNISTNSYNPGIYIIQVKTDSQQESFKIYLK